MYFLTFLEFRFTPGRLPVDALEMARPNDGHVPFVPPAVEAGDEEVLAGGVEAHDLQGVLVSPGPFLI